MAIAVQYAEDTAEAPGDAIFTFPDVPQGAIYCGPTIIPAAPRTASALVLAGGQVIGNMRGAGMFGPWVADDTRKLSIVCSGLVVGQQYVAVWHAEVNGPQRLPEVIAAELVPAYAPIETPVTCPAGDTTNVLPSADGPYYLWSWGVTNLVESVPPPTPALIAQSGFGGSDVIFEPIDVLDVTGSEQWSDRPGGMIVRGLWVTNNTPESFDVGAVAALVNP